MSNITLIKAAKAKNDEFYTQYADIEKELQYYNFEDKIVYCNCDHPIQSNFVKYFCDNYHKLKLKGLISTFYSEEGKSFVYRYDGLKESKKGLNGNGSYDSEECLKLLEECDVVVTNPPFSLFREYVKLLMDYNKKFLIIGNMNAITYKEIFPYIKNDQMWWGVSLNGTKCNFVVPENYEGNNVFVENGIRYGKVNNAIWFTNITFINTKQPLILTKTYNPTDYPHYDNYEAINVDKVKDIPIDYDGVMGVPITFLSKYNPSQFEILGIANNVRWIGDFPCLTKINGNKIYNRILIKKNDSLESVEFEIVGWSRHNDLDMDGGYWLGGCNDATINGKIVYRRILIKKR